MMAEDYIRMGITKAQDMEPLEPFQPEEEMSIRLLVVGGGLAGITASLEAAKAGYEVVLVEKEDRLGGWMNKLHKQVPQRHPYRDLEDRNIEAKIKAVEAESRIKVYRGATVDKTVGAPCLFEAHISQNDHMATERVGAVILATGAVPYDAGKLGHLGFGRKENVITNVTMEELAGKGPIVRPSDGRRVKSVAFVLCAGSRDPEHLPYCCSTGCIESLKQAKYLRNQDRDAKAYIIYQDLRASGFYEYFYKSVQEDEGIFFTKGEVKDISEVDNKNIILEIEDSLLGEDIQLKVDMVVLVTGMVPTTALGEEIDLGLNVEEEEAATKEENAEAPADTIIRSGLLNLEYRQGPEVPPLQYGFPDSHFICFPHESRRTGIYPAG
ncbi:MAG: FAD-dependent oxidoreductase, partial [Dehalococcoidia bacterium]|nr:FAD-dependent oxidoreductase [Dehalococcoidia bacterium]